MRITLNMYAIDMKTQNFKIRYTTKSLNETW